MGLPYAKARTTPTGTSKHYRNLEQAESMAAVKVEMTDASLGAPTYKWFARAVAPDEDEYWFLSAAGYVDEATCQAAIETALGTPI